MSCSAGKKCENSGPLKSLSFHLLFYNFQYVAASLRSVVWWRLISQPDSASFTERKEGKMGLLNRLFGKTEKTKTGPKVEDSKEWMCQKCHKRFMVPIDEHKRCMDSRKRVFPTCTHCGGNYSMATDVVVGKEDLPKWIEMKNPNVHIHNELALIREITFDGKGRASEKCCGNCREFTIPIGGKHWCTKYSQEVDQKDLCEHWFERKVFLIA
jgi:DNA-directed RNA polymerase subunit M/transcription elongation factor TFIIS